MMRRAGIAVLMLTLAAGAGATVPKKKPVAKKHVVTSKKGKSKMPTASAARGRQSVPDGARSREIQEALQRDGYLKTAPSGKWDSSTSDALSRYQTAHGVRATGKPDAHSLISLGLGPKYPNF